MCVLLDSRHQTEPHNTSFPSNWKLKFAHKMVRAIHVLPNSTFHNIHSSKSHLNMCLNLHITVPRILRTVLEDLQYLTAIWQIAIIIIINNIERTLQRRFPTIREYDPVQHILNGTWDKGYFEICNVQHGYNVLYRVVASLHI